MPSLFTNDTSKGPLYQYWRERSVSEEKPLRDQRIEEAKLRAKGFSPMDAVYGPSSKQSYSSREERGPPGYAGDATSASAAAVAPATDDLPAYEGDTTASPTGDAGLLSASEEKARLNQLEAQHRQTESDAAVARSLSNEVEGADAEGKGKQPERRKSTAGKIGRWFADAASGYTKKQERW
jgi:hypothetical protein